MIRTTPFFAAGFAALSLALAAGNEAPAAVRAKASRDAARLGRGHAGAHCFGN